LNPNPVLVAQYNPPKEASPAVAAWLLERGALPRVMAAAIVNTAAKNYLCVSVPPVPIGKQIQSPVRVSLVLTPAHRCGHRSEN
jgi:hypothetical protein